MKKYLLLPLISVSCFVSAFTQNAYTLWVDSLKNQLPHLRDSAKVDGLNELAKAFGSMGHAGWDSIYRYAFEANNVAVRIGYKKGEAFSLLNLASSERKNLPAAEAYIKKAIKIGEDINNAGVLGCAYLAWSWNLLNEQRIAALQRALHYFKIAGEIEGEADANTWLCESYLSRGEYEEGFKYCAKCVQIAKQAAHTPWGHELVLVSFENVANLYQTAGDYETALEYYREGNQYAQEHQLRWNMDISIGTLLCQLGQYDSAFYYWTKWEKQANPYALSRRAYISGLLAQIYLKQKKYNEALAISKEGIEFFRHQENAGFSLTGHLLNAAKVYTEMKSYKTALTYARDGLKLAESNSNRQAMVEGYLLIADIYQQIGDHKQAYFNLQKHITLKDSILNRQFLLRLNNYKNAAEEANKESRIGLLNRDNQIKQQQLKQEATFRNFIIAFFSAVIFAGLFIFRNFNQKRKDEKLRQAQKEQEWKLQQLEHENKQSELQRQAAELEMQALRAQMNPHFIFNCLASINRFILKNESKTASNYLTRFSRLMRMVLLNSQKQLISLDDELQMLELYLEMERLRFKNSFDYSITFLNTLDSDNIFIPPLLLQPFCENAIWHGLMHLPAGRHNMEVQGRLDIELSMQGKILTCVITDNGVGREKAEEMKSKTAEKEKSMGLKITTERLSLLNSEKGLHTFYEIVDLKDENGIAAGTKVTLKISFMEPVKETA